MLAPCGLSMEELYVNENNVYYDTESEVIYSVPKSGGQLQPLYTEPRYTAPYLWAMDSTSLYVGNNNHIDQVSKSGGTPNQIFTDSNYPVTVLGTDDTSVYFFSSTTGVASYVGAVPKAGGTSTQLATIDSSEVLEFAMVDSGEVIYSTVIPQPPPSNVARIYSLATTGGQPVLLSSVSNGNSQFAAAGGSVYFQNQSSIEKVSAQGGSPNAIATVSNHFEGFFGADATNLYWAESPGCIFKVAK